MSKLAIVIPSFKEIFFEKALQSLADQTNKNFTVYIGDDCSPGDLKSIADKFSSKIKIFYTRFENNIGAKNLVNQWNRCVNLVKNEEWIWLFSDDDLADANCVEEFYRTTQADNNRFDVYRFNTRVINDQDEIIAQTNKSPFIDSSFNMANEILLGKRGNSMPDHIFSRKVYLKNKGFVYTDFAQAADWATSILFSRETGICTISNAKVSWRLGDYNISGQATKNRGNMLKGHIQFLIWLLKHFEYLKIANDKKFLIIKKSAKLNLRQVIIYNYRGLDFSNFWGITKFYYRSDNNLMIALLSCFHLYFLLKVVPFIKTFFRN